MLACSIFKRVLSALGIPRLLYKLDAATSSGYSSPLDKAVLTLLYSFSPAFFINWYIELVRPALLIVPIISLAVLPTLPKPTTGAKEVPISAAF